MPSQELFLTEAGQNVIFYDPVSKRKKKCGLRWCYWCLKARTGNDGYKKTGHHPWCCSYKPPKKKQSKAGNGSDSEAEEGSNIEAEEGAD